MTQDATVWLVQGYNKWDFLDSTQHLAGSREQAEEAAEHARAYYKRVAVVKAPRLSAAMIDVLRKLDKRGRATAAELDARQSTLDALSERGLINCLHRDNQAWRYPRTRISYGLNVQAEGYIG